MRGFLGVKNQNDEKVKMLEVSTKVKRIRGTDHCQRGHNRWGYVRGNTRYCLDCSDYRTAKKKFRAGIFGEKTITKFEAVLDFEIVTLRQHIRTLEQKIKNLELEKISIRETYKSKKSKKKEKKRMYVKHWAIEQNDVELSVMFLTKRDAVDYADRNLKGEYLLVKHHQVDGIKKEARLTKAA